MTKNTRILSVGFFFVFMAFHAVERYVGVFFDGTLGLWLLCLGYFSLFTGDFVSPLVIAKLGTKKSLMFGSLCYFLFIVALATHVLWLVFIATIFVGFSAALIWNGMAFSVLLGQEDELGGAFGSILAFYGIGAGIGLLLLSFLLSSLSLSLPISFLVLSSFCLIGFGFFSTLKEVDGELPQPAVADIVEAYMNPTILRLASISLMTFIIFVLMVSTIPIQLNELLGIEYIGVLSSLAFFALGACYFLPVQVRRWGYNRLIITLYILLTLGLTFLILSSVSALLFVAGIFCVGFSFAFLFVVRFAVTDCAPLHKQSVALAVFASVDDLTISIGMGVVAFITGEGVSPPYIYGATLVLAAFSFFLLYPLLRSGRNLEEAKCRLEEDYP